MDIVEFLRARIDNDENTALMAGHGCGWVHDHNAGWIQVEFPSDHNTRPGYDLWFIELFNPDRILAECSSKREIIAVHPRVMTKDTDLEGDYPWDDVPACDNCRGDEHDEWYREPYPCVTLKALALPYKDHPDYRTEWSL